MINLITGATGSGKSAFCMVQLLELLKEGLPLFVHGIPNLSIPHTLVICDSPLCDVCPVKPLEPIEPSEPSYDAHILDLKQYAIDLSNYKKLFSCYENDLKVYNKNLFAHDWDKWSPEGALLVFDEVHYVYPTLSDSASRPDSVPLFTTHRHKGLDFYFMTQSPLLFDKKVRLLVGKHIHITSTWSGRYQYEFARCQDSIVNLSSGVRSTYKLDKKVFSLYKSSSLHTKQKKKIPFAVYILPVLFLVIFSLFYVVKHRFDSIGYSNDLSNSLVSSDPGEVLSSDSSVVDRVLTSDLVYTWASSGVPLADFDLMPVSCVLSRVVFKCPPFSIPFDFLKGVSVDKMCIRLACFIYFKIRSEQNLSSKSISF